MTLALIGAIDRTMTELGPFLFFHFFVFIDQMVERKIELRPQMYYLSLQEILIHDEFSMT